MKSFLCLSLLGYICFCSAHEQIYFPLKNSDILNNSEVEIAGFLTKDESGRWMLSDQPLIRSCCVAKKTEGATLLFVTSLPINEWPIYKVIRLRGTFKKEENGLSLDPCTIVGHL